ncbi:unnamed protein product [Linum trigynum]|uniref:Peptide N-acetyl-beta-D-glucosaminyl asparaginase amidase A N-terminal domain-containing protein n=1 Tax=Linum trigynum TaxID=586398 RepID=A0AAV2CVB3_9ROSI
MTWFPLSSPHLFFSFLLLLILCPFNSINASPNLKRPKGFFHKSSLKQQSAKPNTLFQVTKPIHVPNTVPCKKLLLQHEFSSTAENPPSCNGIQRPSFHLSFQRFLQDCLGIEGQFQRSTGRWGIWSLVGRSRAPQELLCSRVQHVDNLGITEGYHKDFIEVYHIAISISFYPLEHKSSSAVLHGHDPDTVNRWYKIESKADLILPISQNLESKDDGLWFQIENSTDLKRRGFRIPQNACKAVLEDEVRNGPFRDVVITLDDKIVVGAIWPYPIIYGAGNDIWNPVVSISNFNFPSYDIELTPFLGALLDERIHNLSFAIGNAGNVWYIDANLHLWLDHRSSRTKGKFVSSYSQPLDLSSKLKMKVPLAGKSWVEARRVLSSQGWLQSSHGNITTRVSQNLSYANYMDSKNEDDYFSSTLQQLVLSNDSVSFVNDSAANDFYSFESVKTFRLRNKEEQKRMKADILDKVKIEIDYGNEKTHESPHFKSTMVNSMKDQQSGSGVVIFKNYSFFSVLGAMNQSYHYQTVEDNTKMCYFRNINSFNYSIVYDKENNKCAK